MIVTSDYTLEAIPAPNLPLAPGQYDSRYQEALNNVLRLYFNRLEGLLGKLHTSGNYTVATLPSAATAGVGARAFVTNATAPTFGATVVGGGAVATPVYSDGTNWKVG